MSMHRQAPLGLSDAVQQIVDRERETARGIRREHCRQRFELICVRLGPVVRGLVWLQMLLPITVVVGFVLPEAALSWLNRIEFVLEILFVYSVFCAPPLVTLLTPFSRLPAAAKGRLIIATWIIGIGLPFALRATFL